jgi:hypothetical protein
MKIETLEKAAEKYRKTTSNNMYLEKTAFIAGAKWQQEQAKEMEKEQIVKAWWESPTMGRYCSAEEYYKETFKKQTNENSSRIFRN